MQFPVAIELRRSAILSLLVVLVHVVAAVGLLALRWETAWFWPLRLALLLAIAASIVYFLSQSSDIVGLILASKTELTCRLVDDRKLVLQVLPDSTVFNQLIVLRLRVGETPKTSNLVLLPDQMSSEQFRMLRVWLRWQVTNDAALPIS